MSPQALLLAALAATAVPPAAPAPPVPPARPVDAGARDGGSQSIITRNVDGHRVTVIARSPGAAAGAPVLAYRDGEGSNVQVYSDRPVSREEADRLLGEAKVEGERWRAEGARAREQGRLALQAGERARIDADRIRREALDGAQRAIAEARLSARDYADLGNLRELRVFRDGPVVTVDGRPAGPGFAERPEVRALRDEVRALREELKSMRAELERERTHR